MKITGRLVTLFIIPLTWVLYVFSDIYFEVFRSALWHLRLLSFLESPLYIAIFSPAILGIWIYFEPQLTNSLDAELVKKVKGRERSVLISGILPVAIGTVIMTCGLFCIYILGPLSILGIAIAAASYIVFCVQVVRLNLLHWKLVKVENKNHS